MDIDEINKIHFLCGKIQSIKGTFATYKAFGDSGDYIKGMGYLDSLILELEKMVSK